MADKTALRELQGRLAERLRTAQADAPRRSWLAVEAGGHGWLFPLAQAGEIHPPVAVTPVPHTRPWFAGVAVLRGALFGVADLAGFLGLPPRPQQDRGEARWVGFSAAADLPCVLRVDRLAGLRGEGVLVPEAEGDEAPRPAFVGGRYRDAAGRPWLELQLAALAQDPVFRDIAA
jgi:twitching motility protein PilI